MDRYRGDWSRWCRTTCAYGASTCRRRTGSASAPSSPKDEKNQDSTELTGDINYRKIAEYGSDSDPRAFNFDGEFNIANRGIIEFVEMLKLDVAFLYDLLGASQEHKIKPKKFAQTDIDEVISGTPTRPSTRSSNNEFMEASATARSRSTSRTSPGWSRRRRDLREGLLLGASGKHIAPHTLEMAAMWAVLTRLEDPKKHNLSLLQKLKLYDGRMPRVHQDNIKELRKEAAPRGHGRHLAALRAGQDLQRAGERQPGEHQPVHGDERAGEGPAPPLLITSDDQRKALLRDSSPW